MIVDKGSAFVRPPAKTATAWEIIVVLKRNGLVRRPPLALPLPLICVMIVASFSTSVLTSLAQDGEDEKVLGRLDEGKTYRRVNGHPLTGKLIADVLVAQRWQTECAGFAEHILVRDAMEKKGIEIPDEEVDRQIKRLTLQYAKKHNLDPRMFKQSRLAYSMGGHSLEFIREQTRDSLGLKQLLVKAGALKTDQKMSQPQVVQIMQSFLQDLEKKHKVELDPAKLGFNEAVRIDQRGYSKDKVRAFILNGLGPMLKKDLEGALQLLTLEYLLSEALKEYGRTEVTRQDKEWHFSYRARLKEHVEGAPNGRDAILFELQRSGLTIDQYFSDRPFTLDAGITFLARQTVRKAAIEAEWQRDPKAYERSAPLIAHLLIRARDPQGRPYGPQWRAQGHKKLNRFVEKIREEQFEKAKKKIIGMQGLAGGNFVESAVKFSEDEETKRNGGLIGRVSLKNAMPTVPIDKEVVKAAMNLKPGELSKPIRSAYGWHLVKCLKNQETSFKELKVQEHIYVVLLKRKRKEISEQWLSEAKIENLY